MKDLKLNLIVDLVDRATAGVRKIWATLEGLEGRVQRFNKVFEKIGVGAILGTGAVLAGVGEASRGIWELTNRTAELGEGFLHSAIKAGTTVEAIQRLRFAAQQLGVDADSLDQVFFRFQNHLANGLKGNKETVFALGELGIKAPDMAALSRNPEEAFKRLVDGFSRITNPTLRAKLAMDLFSRSGYEILPMLAAGRDAIQKFEDQLDGAHAVMSTKDAEAAEEFIQNKNRMGLALRGLQMQIGTRLLPVMSRVIDKITEWIEHLQPQVVTRFTRAIETLIDKLPQLFPRFERALELTMRLADVLLRLSGDAGVVKGALALLALFVGAQFLAAMVEGALAIGKIGAAIKALGVTSIIGAIGTFVGEIIAMTSACGPAITAMSLLDVAMDANPIGVIVVAIGLLIAAVAALVFAALWLAKNWRGVWAGIVAIGAGAANLLKSAWSGVKGFFAALWNGIEKIFRNAWTRITAGMPGWLRTMLKIGAIGLVANVSPVAAAAMAAGAAHPGAPRAIAPGPNRAIPRGVAGARAAAAPNGKVDVAIRLTQDGRAKVKSVRSSTPDVNATLYRGIAPG